MTQDHKSAELLTLYLLINSCVHYVLFERTHGKLTPFDLQLTVISLKCYLFLLTVTETISLSLINYKVRDDNKKRVKIMQVRVVIMLQYISSEISRRTDGKKLFIFSK